MILFRFRRTLSQNMRKLSSSGALVLLCHKVLTDSA